MSETLRLSVNIKLPEKAIIALILALVVPSTFYWAGYVNESDPFSLYAFEDAATYITQSTTLFYATLSYLAILTAFLVKNRPAIKSLMMVLATILQFTSLTQFTISVLSNTRNDFFDTLQIVFIYTDGYFPFQLLTTFALIPLLYLFRQNYAWLRSEITKFVSNLKLSGNNLKTIFAYSASALLASFAVYGIYSNSKAIIDFNAEFSRGFHPEIILAFIAYLFDLVFTVLLLSILLIYFFNHFDYLNKEIRELNSVLRDFKLSNYVTRQISGYLYWFYYVLIVGFFAIIGPYQTFVEFEQTRRYLDSGFQPQLILILIGIPLLTLFIAYFVILILRLVFELLIALIHIAQNTVGFRR